MTKARFFLQSLLLVFVVSFATVSVQAQTVAPENPVAGATPGGVNEGSSSDSELWRQIRRGNPGTVVGGDPNSGMMIQSAGQDWRMIRNDQLPKYAAWAILGMLLLLSLFFAIRGRMKISHGPSGRTITRFSLIERVGHWLLASSFILLALTGLNLIFGKSLLIPLLGKDAFASITVFGKLVHNYVGFAFMLGLIMIVVMWIWHNIPTLTDVKWLFRAGGMLGGGHPHARKFNAGQKIIFWLVVLCGISISLSGWALMNPFTTNMFSGTFEIANSWFGTSYQTDLTAIQEQQYQSLWHAIMAVFMIVVILAHIYIGSVGMEGALPAMTTGDVDTNWAKEHHSIWAEEEEAKSWGHNTPQFAGGVSAKSNPGDVLSEPHATPTAALAQQAGVTRDTSGSPASPKVDSASDSRPPSRRLTSRKPSPSKSKAKLADTSTARQPAKPAADASAKKSATPKKKNVASTNAKKAASTGTASGSTKASTKPATKNQSARKPKVAARSSTVERKPAAAKKSSSNRATTQSRTRAGRAGARPADLRQAVAGGMAVNASSSKTRAKKPMTPRERSLAKAAAERAGIQAASANRSGATKLPATKSKSARKTAARSTAKSAVKRVRKPQSATRKRPARAKSTVRDDLKRISGVGPVIEKKLNKAGIFQFADIAAWRKADERTFSEQLDFPGRIEREEWVKQAKALAKQLTKG